MPTIDVNMSLFDSPRPTAPMTVAQSDDHYHHDDKKEEASYLGYDDDGDDDLENQQDGLDQEEESGKEQVDAESESAVDYQDLLVQAAKWKKSMHGVLDAVYKLRIQAAITLDKIAMMYPPSHFLERQDDTDKNNGAVADAASKDGQGVNDDEMS